MDDFATVGFQARKAAQIAAYFVGRAGQSIDKVRLMKLIYLSERNFIKQHSEPMLYDELYSFELGPVCSNTLDGVNGAFNGTWSPYVQLSPDDKMTVVSGATFSRNDLDELSDVEMEVLNSAWTSFGWMNRDQIVNYTHVNCPEYTETVKGTKAPIQYEELFRILGFSHPEELAKEIDEYRRISGVLPA